MSSEIKTQVIDDDDADFLDKLPNEEEEEDVPPKPWGRLVCLDKTIESIDLLPLEKDDRDRYNVHTIGRSKNCNSSLEGCVAISNTHCTIFAKLNEALDKSLSHNERLEAWIVDSSSNGTYLNKDSIRLKPGVERLLHHGDVIHLISPVRGRAADGSLGAEVMKFSFMFLNFLSNPNENRTLTVSEAVLKAAQEAELEGSILTPCLVSLKMNCNCLLLRGRAGWGSIHLGPQEYRFMHDRKEQTTAGFLPNGQATGRGRLRTCVRNNLQRFGII